MPEKIASRIRRGGPYFVISARHRHEQLAGNVAVGHVPEQVQLALAFQRPDRTSGGTTAPDFFFSRANRAEVSLYPVALGKRV